LVGNSLVGNGLISNEEEKKMSERVRERKRVSQTWRKSKGRCAGSTPIHLYGDDS
jgi:hypothetical protein